MTSSPDPEGATDEYDYKGAFDLIDAGEPSAEGCMGCFRCRAGDHATCHGCSCPCAWHYSPGLRDDFAAVIGPDLCREGCGSHG